MTDQDQYGVNSCLRPEGKGTPAVKAQELRVGNWIFDSFDRPLKVTEIKEGRVRALYRGESNTETQGLRNGLFKLEECRPIRLDLEIMKASRFYFKDNSDAWLYLSLGRMDKQWFIMRSYDIEDTYIVQWKQAGIMPPCKYLHQLQNLYFALTGEELNITL